MGELHGEVTLDDQPLPQGSLLFEPLDGKGSIGGCEIEGGRYAVTLLVNTYRVRISAAAAEPPAAAANDGYVPREILPPRYNERSELTADVRTGSNPLDFRLQSR